MPDELDQRKEINEGTSGGLGDTPEGSPEQSASGAHGGDVTDSPEQGGEETGQPVEKKEKRTRKKKQSQPQQKQDVPAASSDSGHMGWYIVKVQTNREDSACEALTRRIKVAGMEQYFGQIIVPVERVTEVKGGKKRVVRRKLYPGYIVVQMELNDDTWFLVRETPGIGDFTGAIGRPTPLLPHEVNRILTKLAEEKAEDAPKLKIGCRVGDRVKINEGHFANFQGEVASIDEANGIITVMINIFGRSTPVELEYWQVEPAE